MKNTNKRNAQIAGWWCLAMALSGPIGADQFIQQK